MHLGRFFAELKRRNKVAGLAGVPRLLIQAASILFPTFEAPARVMNVFATAILFGFSIALILAGVLDFASTLA